jgi:hypothetical protein
MSISHGLLNPAFHHGVRHQGRIRGIIFELSRRDDFLTHPQKSRQPTTPNPIHCDNATAVDIANNTIKQQLLQAMEMRYFWTRKKAQDVYSFKW